MAVRALFLRGMGHKIKISDSIKTHAIRNVDSARVSVPGIIRKNDEQSGPSYIWRTPLKLTASYWESAWNLTFRSPLLIKHFFIIN
jgi:hypothetical protein